MKPWEEWGHGVKSMKILFFKEKIRARCILFTNIISRKLKRSCTKSSKNWKNNTASMYPLICPAMWFLLLCLQYDKTILC